MASPGFSSATTSSIATSAPPSLVGADVMLAMLGVAQGVPPGCFVEVGVYKGGSAWHLSWLAQMQHRELYLYDTFDGIPYCDPHLDPHKNGDFGDTNEFEVRHRLPTANVVRGIFPDSAVAMPPIAFVHLDCDQYRSYRDSLEFLIPKVVKGGVIWLDDYGYLPGATRAVDEFFVPTQRLCGKAFVTL